MTKEVSASMWVPGPHSDKTTSRDLRILFYFLHTSRQVEYFAYQ